MRTYEVFRVKKKYKPFVLGREKLLNELLINNEKNYNETKEISCMCEKIATHNMDSSVIKRLGQLFKKMEYKNGQFTLTHPKKGSLILSFTTYSIIVHCHGSRMLEADLFSSISHTNKRFFTINEERDEYGWLG